MAWQALQAQGARVTLTDRAVQLPLLRRNVAENFGAPELPCPVLRRLFDCADGILCMQVPTALL